MKMFTSLHVAPGRESEKKPRQKVRDQRLDLRPRLTFLVAHVGVEALGLEHDEERAPSQQHGGEQQVLNDGGHGHPPAPGEGCGQGRSHGRRLGAGSGEGVEWRGTRGDS